MCCFKARRCTRSWTAACRLDDSSLTLVHMVLRITQCRQRLYGHNWQPTSLRRLGQRAVDLPFLPYCPFVGDQRRSDDNLSNNFVDARPLRIFPNRTPEYSATENHVTRPRAHNKEGVHGFWSVFPA
jgi:hypothetical protein